MADQAGSLRADSSAPLTKFAVCTPNFWMIMAVALGGFIRELRRTPARWTAIRPGTGKYFGGMPCID
jgi:hypothetical protein